MNVSISQCIRCLCFTLNFGSKLISVTRQFFPGIIQLSGCTAENILDAITKFYADHALDMNNMVMFTSDGASVMVGRHKGWAALLKRQVPHLTEQHCMAHRGELGIDDAWKDVPIIKKGETLLGTVYSMFCRSSVKKAKFTEMAEVLEVDHCLLGL